MSDYKQTSRCYQTAQVPYLKTASNLHAHILFNSNLKYVFKEDNSHGLAKHQGPWVVVAILGMVSVKQEGWSSVCNEGIPL